MRKKKLAATSKRPSGSQWAKDRAATRKAIAEETGQFRSKFEAQLAKQLKDAGVSILYECERIPYHTEHHYKPDFKLPSGALIEVKGYWLPEDRAKHLLIKKQHPELDIRFVLQTPNRKLSKKSKTSYAEWCDRHGFKWAGKAIPDAWLTK